MAHGHFKEFPGRTASDEFLLDKAFDIAKNPKLSNLSKAGFQCGLVSMVCTFFDKKS